ncbi:MAG: TerB family tellurite resistance protein, partial [Deltaproteobacteria bacterium]|nr:TerB family tellurite resistance protein [Deltaproteobacteria bacterium]
GNGQNFSYYKRKVWLTSGTCRCLDSLIAEAEKELEGSIDLWQFTSLINSNYSMEEKIEIIETLWQIVYVDGKMDRYEHYLMNKLKTLLRLSHAQLIDAKLKVLSRLN